MHRIPFPNFLCQLLLGTSLLALVSASASAQTSSITPAPASEPATGIEPRVEHIRLEDKGSVIEELRVGGQTQSIQVTPKGGMPGYQVAPTTGQRSWKVLGF